jgi:hypothetical protein
MLPGQLHALWRDLALPACAARSRLPKPARHCHITAAWQTRLVCAPLRDTAASRAANPRSPRNGIRESPHWHSYCCVPSEASAWAMKLISVAIARSSPLWAIRATNTSTRHTYKCACAGALRLRCHTAPVRRPHTWLLRRAAAVAARGPDVAEAACGDDGGAAVCAVLDLTPTPRGPESEVGNRRQLSKSMRDSHGTADGPATRAPTRPRTPRRRSARRRCHWALVSDRQVRSVRDRPA